MLRSQKSLLCSSSRFPRLPIRSPRCAVPAPASCAGVSRREWRGLFSCRARALFTPPSTSTASTTSTSTIVNSHNLTRSLQKKSFSSTSAAMTATKIDGTATAKEIRESIRAEIENTQKSNPRYKPSLKIIQVGERSDSSKSDLELYERLEQQRVLTMSQLQNQNYLRIRSIV
jgi:hypothetical protein